MFTKFWMLELVQFGKQKFAVLLLLVYIWYGKSTVHLPQAEVAVSWGTWNAASGHSCHQEGTVAPTRSLLPAGTAQPFLGVLLPEFAKSPACMEACQNPSLWAPAVYYTLPRVYVTRIFSPSKGFILCQVGK